MSRWMRIRESFWFIPGVLCGLAVVVAEVLIAVDRRLGEVDLGPFAALINTVGVSGSRDLLGAIAGSMLTVAATTFSITIAVLAMASSTYGPRLVRNFMADRSNQFVLGVFTATFLYALMALRSITTPDGTDEVFVPHLAVNFAVLLGVLAIGVLVYFINHIADSVQVWTLSRQVRTELLTAVDRLYPEQMGRGPAGLGSADVPDRMREEGLQVPARDAGYVQNVQQERLMDAASEHDLVVELRVRPGSHVTHADTLAVLWPPDRVRDDHVALVRNAIGIGRSRTPHQDIDFAVLILEEMAVRALSPSTNDPYTALNALDDLATGLVRLAGRSMPSPYRHDDQGRLRVIAPRVDLVDLVDRVFDAMRHYALGHPMVVHRTLGLAGQVGTATGASAVRARLAEHVELLQQAFEARAPQERDLGRLREHVAQARGAL